MSDLHAESYEMGYREGSSSASSDWQREVERLRELLAAAETERDGLRERAQGQLAAITRAEAAEARVEALTEAVDVLRSAGEVAQAGWEAAEEELRIANERGDAWRDELRLEFDRLEATKAALARLLEACDEYENSGYSGGFHEAKSAARAALGVPVVPQEARCPTCGSTDPNTPRKFQAGFIDSWRFCDDPWHSVGPQETEAG